MLSFRNYHTSSMDAMRERKNVYFIKAARTILIGGSLMAYLQKSNKVWAVLIALVVMAAMLVVQPAQAAASKFTDVSAKYSEAVDYLLDNGITVGISDTEYGTYLPIKRVDASIMLAKALKLETSSNTVSGFADVPKRGEPAVKALRDGKIVLGKTDTHFGAYDNIMRGEMALILAKGYKLSGEGTEVPFTDVAPHYKPSVAALIKHEITYGKDAVTYGTHDDITRGEFALFLHRLSKLAVEQGAIDLTVLQKGLLDGSISLDELLSNPNLLRVSLPLEGLAVGDVVKLGTGDVNLLSVTLTQDDLNKGYVNLGLSTDILKTLTGGVPLDLVAVLETGEQVLESATKTIKLPSLLVTPVLDLAKNAVADLSYILSGEKELIVDIDGEAIQAAKAGDQLKLTINASGITENLSKVITAADVQAGVVKYTFTDMDLVGRLLEGLTVGSDIVITPAITDGNTTSTGAPVSYEVTEGVLEGLIDLLVGLLGSVLAGDVLEGVTEGALTGVLDGVTTDVLAGVLAGGALGDVLGTVLGGDLLGGDLIGGLLGGSLLEGLEIGDLLGGDVLGSVVNLLDGLGLGNIVEGLGLGGLLGGLGL